MPTFPALLRAAGYATALFGKWHLGSAPGAPGPGAYGFDVHVTTSSTGPSFPQQGEPCFRARSTEFIVDEAIAFIEENAGGPFFLAVWTLLPHATLDPTPEQLATYESLGPDGVEFAGAREIYYASVTAMDAQLGRLLDRLDELGLSESTLVLFTSDNGPATIHSKATSHSGVGTGGPFRGRKRSLYEGGVRMPLIARWPGRVPAPRRARRARFRSPAPATRPTRTSPRTPTARTSPTSCSAPQGRANGPWKLLFNPDGTRSELYHVVADPGETDNLAAGQPEIAAALEALAGDWRSTLPTGTYDGDAGSNAYPWPE